MRMTPENTVQDDIALCPGKKVGVKFHFLFQHQLGCTYLFARTARTLTQKPAQLHFHSRRMPTSDIWCLIFRSSYLTGSMLWVISIGCLRIWLAGGWKHIINKELLSGGAFELDDSGFKPQLHNLEDLGQSRHLQHPSSPHL